jgi:hypothetical protein
MFPNGEISPNLVTPMLTDKKEVMSELVRIDFFPVWYRFSREKP